MLWRAWLRAATCRSSLGSHAWACRSSSSSSMSQHMAFSPLKSPRPTLPPPTKPSPAHARLPALTTPAAPAPRARQALCFSTSSAAGEPARSRAAPHPTAAAAAAAATPVVLDFPPGLAAAALGEGLKMPAEHDTPLSSLEAAVEESLRPPYTGDGPGRLEVIMGPMFAGKSTALLSKVEAALGAGDPVTIVKSAKDRRYSDHWVVAHTGRCVRCHTADSLMEWREAAPAAYASAKVLAIDEAQFFEDLVEFATEACDVDGKVVLVAGLSGDFRRAPFGRLLELVPLATSITLLKAACFTCGQPAEFSLRVAASADQELVGGADKYRAACRTCYVDHTRRAAAAAAHPEALLLKGAGVAGPITPLVPSGARGAAAAPAPHPPPSTGGAAGR